MTDDRWCQLVTVQLPFQHVSTVLLTNVSYRIVLGGWWMAGPWIPRQHQLWRGCAHLGFKKAVQYRVEYHWAGGGPGKVNLKIRTKAERQIADM